MTRERTGLRRILQEAFSQPESGPTFPLVGALLALCALVGLIAVVIAWIAN